MLNRRGLWDMQDRHGPGLEIELLRPRWHLKACRWMWWLREYDEPCGAPSFKRWLRGGGSQELRSPRPWSLNTLGP